MKLSARGFTLRQAQGFTLIELLVVISIIAVLSVVGVAVFRGVTSAAQDARRKEDVDSIAKAYEINTSGGKYVAIADSQFASGKKPKDPSPKDPTKPDYFNWLAGDGSGYQACASLDKNSSPVCNTSATNCYCRFSSQSTISSSSISSSPDISSTNYGSGPGGGSSSSCDTGGSLSVGLVGYWKLDEAPLSAQAADSSTSNNIGSYLGGATTTTTTSTNPSPPAPISSSAAIFPNSTSYISIPDPLLRLQSTQLTASFWIYPTSISSTAEQDVLTRWYNPTSTGSWGIWKPSGSTNNFIRMYFKSGNFINSPTLSDNTWYHLAFTYDGSTLRVYRNGTFTTSSTFTWSDTGTNSVTIGNALSSVPFYGFLDDVRIYNRPLLGPEISLLYGGCVVP